MVKVATTPTQSPVGTQTAPPSVSAQRLAALLGQTASATLTQPATDARLQEFAQNLRTTVEASVPGLRDAPEMPIELLGLLQTLVDSGVHVALAKVESGVATFDVALSEQGTLQVKPWENRHQTFNLEGLPEKVRNVVEEALQTFQSSSVYTNTVQVHDYSTPRDSWWTQYQGSNLRG